MTTDDIEPIPEINPQSNLLKAILIAIIVMLILVVVWAFSTGRLP